MVKRTNFHQCKYTLNMTVIVNGYIIEQVVTSGGVLPPSFKQQFVFTIEEYPQELVRKSKERFLEMIDLLEDQLK